VPLAVTVACADSAGAVALMARLNEQTTRRMVPPYPKRIPLRFFQLGPVTRGNLRAKGYSTATRRAHPLLRWVTLWR
jgi:hypothetical protein